MTQQAFSTAERLRSRSFLDQLENNAPLSRNEQERQDEYALRERVRQKLLSDGNMAQAAQMGQALIGTVNGVCGKLLERFAFEAGLSPDQKVLEEEQGKRLFGAALEGLLAHSPEHIPRLNAIHHAHFYRRRL